MTSPYNFSSFIRCSPCRLGGQSDQSLSYIDQSKSDIVAHFHSQILIYKNSLIGSIEYEISKTLLKALPARAGEFLRLLYHLAPDENKFYAEGMKEVEEEIEKLSKKSFRNSS